jgi:hypothetical protein
MQDPLPEEIKVGPAVHLPLDQFQPVDLAFELAGAPGLTQCCLHCWIIPLEAGGKGLQVGNPTGSRCAQPRSQCGGGAVLHQRAEALHERIGDLHLPVLSNPREDRPLFSVQARVLAEQQPNQLPRGRHRRPGKRQAGRGRGACGLCLPLMEILTRGGGRGGHPPLLHPAGHRFAGAGKALRLEFVPQLKAILAACLPVDLQIRLVGGKGSQASDDAGPARGRPQRRQRPVRYAG